MNMRTEAAIAEGSSGAPGAWRETLNLRIGGMTCTHCPPAIETAELMPKEPGEFGFARPMGMFRGRLIVE